MAYMQWTDDLSTRIPVIDDQHKRIVDYINELDHASKSGSAEEIKHVLDSLVDYTVTHFDFEEELMQKANYPFFKAHKRVHDIFKRRIENFLQRFAEGENVSKELLEMLKVWLVSHIRGDDSDYVESVKMVVASDDQEDTNWLTSTLHRLFGSHSRASGSNSMRT